VRRMAGDKARRKGLAIRSSVVKVKVDEVLWIWRGRLSSRRAVSRERAKGMRENSRSLEKLVSDWNRDGGDANKDI